MGTRLLIRGSSLKHVRAIERDDIVSYSFQLHDLQVQLVFCNFVSLVSLVSLLLLAVIIVLDYCLQCFFKCT